MSFEPKLLVVPLCCPSPLSTPPPHRYVFTVIYTIEMLGKIIGLGFIMHEHAYLKDGWNWLDFIVVMMGWVRW